MEIYSYKGISAGKYVEGEIEALNQDEASFKLKEQKLIITNLIKTKKKTGEKKEKTKGKGKGFSDDIRKAGKIEVEKTVDMGPSPVEGDVCLIV